MNCPLSPLGINSPPINPLDTSEKEAMSNTTTPPSVMSLWLNAHLRILDIQLVNLSSILSNQRMNFSKGFFPVRCSSLPKRDDNQGTTVKDTKRLSPVAITTVIQNSLNMFETSPLVNEMGRNTTMITRVMEVTVVPISDTPSSAARTLFLPIFICRYIFSSTTIASSTKMPTTSDSASSDIRLSVKPRAYM